MLNLDALQQLKQLKQEIHSNRNLATGTVKGTTSKFGFVTLAETGKDVFLSPDEMLKVFPGDEIEVEIFSDSKKKDYAVVLKLIRSELKVFTGEFKVKNKACFAEPDINGMSRWLFIPPNKTKGCKEGDLIKCKVTQHPLKTGKPQVEVLEVLGKTSKPFIEREYTIAKYDLPVHWSKKINELLTQLPEKVHWEASKRQDLRQLPFVTIDSASTQDMDDALYAEQTENGWKVLIAIADPTEFIAPGSAIEKEAFNRGTSVYYPGQVISMLPEEIANKLSSLVEGEDRLAIICDMDIDNEGNIRSYQLTEGVIHSQAKLSYEAVADYLENSRPLLKNTLSDAPDTVSEDIAAGVSRLAQVFALLNQWRYKNALINDERPDYRTRLNDKGKIDKIIVVKPNIAHKIVEECMIAANRCAADFMANTIGSGLFITHRGIRKERLESIGKIIEQDIVPQHGADAITDKPDTLEGFKNLLQLAERTQASVSLRTAISRQLERSTLSEKAEPHCGMGLPLYTNFTSPIRKFNDFYVHRLIKNKINGAPYHQLTPENITALQNRQMTSRQAANETENWLKWQYMESLADQTFQGVIQRSNSAGFFVKLTDNGIEGFVSTKDMPEKYSFDQVYMTLKSKSRTFTLDQVLTVKCGRVDKKRHQIIFDIVEEAKPDEVVSNESPAQENTVPQS